MLVTLGEDTLVVLTRWGAVVQLTPSPSLGRVLGGLPAGPTHALSLAPALHLAREGKEGKAAGKGSSGTASLCVHATGARVVFFDGLAAVELTFPR